MEQMCVDNILFEKVVENADWPSYKMIFLRNRTLQLWFYQDVFKIGRDRQEEYIIEEDINNQVNEYIFDGPDLVMVNDETICNIEYLVNNKLRLYVRERMIYRRKLGWMNNV